MAGSYKRKHFKSKHAEAELFRQDLNRKFMEFMDAHNAEVQAKKEEEAAPDEAFAKKFLDKMRRKLGM